MRCAGPARPVPAAPAAALGLLAPVMESTDPGAHVGLSGQSLSPLHRRRPAATAPTGKTGRPSVQAGQLTQQPIVESAPGAVPELLPGPFSKPLAEPRVRHS